MVKFILVFILSSSFAWASRCKQARDNYAANIRAVKNTCEKDSDCQTFGALRFNACAIDMALPKTTDKKLIEKLRAELIQVWKTCDYVHPPCAYISAKAYCKEGACHSKMGMPDIPPHGLRQPKP